MLIITIAGGLAANLGTVILVGGAIALVHVGKASAGNWLAAALVGLAAGGFAFVLGNVYRRRDRGSLRQGPYAFLSSLYNVIIIGIGLLLMLEAVLIMIGLAAGIK